MSFREEFHQGRTRVKWRAMDAIIDAKERLPFGSFGDQTGSATC